VGRCGGIYGSARRARLAGFSTVKEEEVTIRSVQTIRCGAYPNLLLLRLIDDGGIVGIGETYFGAAAVESYIHERAVKAVLGREVFEREGILRGLRSYLGYGGSSVELRGRSAIDIALWDMFGKQVKRPLFEVLGGAIRDQVRIYNTCAGPAYTRREPEPSTRNWGLLPAGQHSAFEDLEAFLHRPGELAKELLASGISGMKIWPFDIAAEESGGHYISKDDLRKAVSTFEQIREAVGDAMDVMVEFHALWSYPMARKIISELDRFEPFWYEDPVRSDHLSELKSLAGDTAVPLALSETLAGREQFSALMREVIPGVVIFDVAWCGGISEARFISDLADAYGLSVAPHDCTGPVVLTVCSHLAVNVPNVIIQETVRAYYLGWYKEIVTALPSIEGGVMRPPEGFGIGTDIRVEFLDRDDVTVRESKL